MFDRYNRHINYLRISVTDRCNLRCRYCMPPDGVALLNRKEILTFEEIVSVVKTAVGMGIDKIRLTGGEPLVRNGITDLVRMIAEVEGIKDLGMTTNGILLSRFALQLKKAGLQRVNISLDTLDRDKYRIITRGGDVDHVLQGIFSALEAGLEPIKINCVVSDSSKEDDAVKLKDFAYQVGVKVRFIKRMDLETGVFSVVEGGDGGNCSICNRLRLTANGMLKPCLFSDMEFPVRDLGAEKALLSALEAKPLRGCHSMKNKFYNIGG
jgi:cyclic pyranopterin phosphate synthase